MLVCQLKWMKIVSKEKWAGKKKVHRTRIRSWEMKLWARARACVCVCVCVCVWKCVCGCVTGWNPANAFHFIGSEHRCRRRRRKDGWKRVEEERKREFDYCWKPIIIFFWQVKPNQMLFKGKIKKKKKFNNILFVTDGFWLLRPH